MTAVADYVDRSLVIDPKHHVRTAWIDIDLCVIGNRAQMSPEAVEKSFRRLLSQGDCGSWPPVNGHWLGKRFIVCDGRHEYIASLMLGRKNLFVAWVEMLS